MPKYSILYDIRLYNGYVEVEADNKAEAEAKFDALVASESDALGFENLLSGCDGTAVEIEKIEKLKDEQ